MKQKKKQPKQKIKNMAPKQKARQPLAGGAVIPVNAY